MSATADARWALEKLECEDWQDTPIEPYCHRLTCKRCLVARALEDAENNERKMAALQQRVERLTDWLEACEAWITHVTAITTERDIPSRQVIEDGVAIAEQARAALADAAEGGER